MSEMVAIVQAFSTKSVLKKRAQKRAQLPSTGFYISEEDQSYQVGTASMW